MSNMSNAHGSLRLRGLWTPTLIRQINRIAKEVWKVWYYSIDLDLYNPDEPFEGQCANFAGCGRWSFNSNLKNLGRWTLEETSSRPELASVFAELIYEMNVKGLIIEVNYSDEESGSLLLCTGSGEISSNGETFEYKEISSCNYDYNWKNYIEVTGDNYGFYELVENMCQRIGVESNEEIEKWIEGNSFPYCYKLESLHEDMQVKFMTLFAPK